MTIVTYRCHACPPARRCPRRPRRARAAGRRRRRARARTRSSPATWRSPSTPRRATTSPRTSSSAAAGFTPSARVNVTLDGNTVASGVPVDGDGRLAVTVQAPFTERGERPFSITVTEAGDAGADGRGAARGHAPSRSTAHAKTGGAVAARIRFRSRLHAAERARRLRPLRRAKGKVRRTVRLAGGAAAPCGDPSVGQAPAVPVQARVRARWIVCRSTSASGYASRRTGTRRCVAPRPSSSRRARHAAGQPPPAAAPTTLASAAAASATPGERELAVGRVDAHAVARA